MSSDTSCLVLRKSWGREGGGEGGGEGDICIIAGAQTWFLIRLSPWPPMAFDFVFPFPYLL